MHKDRVKFTKMLAELLLWLNEQPGYEAVLGEVKRTAEQQKIYVDQGKSKTMKSWHIRGLAADIELFKDGIYLEKNEDYKIMADKWKSMDAENVAGYDWGWDGNHVQYKKI